jgi:hypothetical protein
MHAEKEDILSEEVYLARATKDICSPNHLEMWEGIWKK